MFLDTTVTVNTERIQIKDEEVNTSPKWSIPSPKIKRPNSYKSINLNPIESKSSSLLHNSLQQFGNENEKSRKKIAITSAFMSDLVKERNNEWVADILKRVKRQRNIAG